MDCRLRSCIIIYRSLSYYLTSLDVGLANHIHADCYLRITPSMIIIRRIWRSSLLRLLDCFQTIWLLPDSSIRDVYFDFLRLAWSIAMILRIFLRIIVTFNAKSWVSSIATQGEKMTSLVIVPLTSEKLTSLVDILHTLDCILNRMIISTDFSTWLFIWIRTTILRIFIMDIWTTASLSSRHFSDSDFSLHFTRDYLFRSRSSELSYGLVYLFLSYWFLLDLYGSIWIYIGFFVISWLFYFFLFRTSIEIGGVSKVDISDAHTKLVSL